MTNRPRDPAWLAQVRRPGPNGRTFWKPGEQVSGSLTGQPVAATGSNLMEDDVTVSDFTPGCAAYAGYLDGNYANMPAVEAYAASQGARAFSYTGSGNPTADAIDIEPGLASPYQAPLFYDAGGRYFYSSASVVASVMAALGSRARDTYKVISAHYIGEHICGPSVCGYPQADATQWTDTYLGKSLDCTEFDAGFFPAANPWPLSNGSTGANVVTLQVNLNMWDSEIKLSPELDEDGDFGPDTEAAVILAQTYFGNGGVAGTVDEALWNDLAAAPPVTPPPVIVPVASLTVSQRATYYLTIARAIVGYTGTYTTTIKDSVGMWSWSIGGTDITLTVALPGPGTYTVTTEAAGYTSTTKQVIVT